MKCVHETTLHLGVPFMGLQQIEAPTFHMALTYLCDISSWWFNTGCVHVNLLCATHCILPSMVFHSTIKCSKYVSSWIFALFYVILKNKITTGITLLHMTILLINVVVICQHMRFTVKLSFIITFKDRHYRLGQISGKETPVGIFEEKGANNFF